MENKVKFGLSNVHYAKISEEGDTTTYATPVAIPGAVSLSLEAEGDKTEFFADNEVYYDDSVNNGYTGDLEIAEVPEIFEKDILGIIKDANGALIEDADAKISKFALMFQVETDQKGKRYVFYKCTVSRPSIESATNEKTKDPKTTKLSITFTPRKDRKVKSVLQENETNKSIYDDFYKSVYEEVKASV